MKQKLKNGAIGLGIIIGACYFTKKPALEIISEPPVNQIVEKTIAEQTYELPTPVPPILKEIQNYQEIEKGYQKSYITEQEEEQGTRCKTDDEDVLCERTIDGTKVRYYNFPILLKQDNSETKDAEYCRLEIEYPDEDLKFIIDDYLCDREPDRAYWKHRVRHIAWHRTNDKDLSFFQTEVDPLAKKIESLLFDDFVAEPEE